MGWWPTWLRIGVASDESGRVRLQYDLTPEAMAELESIVSLSGLGTKGETVRQALRIYAWVLDAQAQGGGTTLEVVIRDQRSGTQIAKQTLPFRR